MRRAALLALVPLAALQCAAKVDPHAYATPTAEVVAPEFDVPKQQVIEIVGNLTDPIPAEERAEQAAAPPTEDPEEDIQAALAKNPNVILARHISYGMLDPEHEPPYACRDSYSIEIVKRDPLVIYIKGFLQPGEAEHMISSAVPLMARSMVASAASANATEQSNKKDEQRTSSSAFFRRGQDAVMTCIEQRAADILGEERSHVEGLQVVMYQLGQKYNPHYDYFPKDSEYYTAYTANGGQRTWTFFVYLTDATIDPVTGERVELEGGHTSFPNLGISFPPEKGAAVLWSNKKLDGLEDERVLHGGDPILRGQKLAINIWFREKEFVQ